MATRQAPRPVPDDFEQEPIKSDYETMLEAAAYRRVGWNAAITGQVTASQFDSFNYGFEMGWRMARGDKDLFPEKGE